MQKQRRRSTAKLINAFVFAARIVQFFFLNPKFQAFSLFQSMYRPVCVKPGHTPEDRVSYVAAHIIVCTVSVLKPACNLTLYC